MDVGSVERQLDVAFPARLRRLYEAGDGRFSEAGQWWVVWPLHRVAADDERAWRHGTLAHHLLAFRQQL